MEVFDPELQTYFAKIKEEIKSEHVQYMKSHPEIRDILNDFLSSLLLEKPDDIYIYARKYFSFFNVDKKPDYHPILVMSGPSGAGKGTLLARLLKEYPDEFEVSVSWTTREQRVGEAQGISYFFKTKEEFEAEIKKDGFVEYCQTHGNFYYGTNKAVLQNIIARGKICILEIDVKGAKLIQNLYKDANYVFINTKNIETLRERIIKRGADGPEQVEKRLKTAETELKVFKEMGVYKEIYNEEFEVSYKELVEHLKSLYPKALGQKNP